MKKEMVNHPDHYKGNNFEVIDIIEDYNLDFCLGNSVKYILRAGKKDSFEQDIKKAIWYLERSLKNKTDDEELDESEVHKYKKRFDEIINVYNTFPHYLETYGREFRKWSSFIRELTHNWDSIEFRVDGHTFKEICYAIEELRKLIQSSNSEEDMSIHKDLITIFNTIVTLSFSVERHDLFAKLK